MALLVLLARGLRPDAFFAGDPGVKLIAARAAVSSPSHPLDVPLPAIAGRPAPYLEPFFAIHGGHAHAVTSELFPLLTAPFLAAAGLRGIYVLPAVGFLAALWAIAALGTTLDGRRGATAIGLTVVVAAPFLFYALELWEHTAAIACGAGAAVAWLRRKPARSGFLFGLAVLLRPEAVWFAVAVGVASLLMMPLRLRDLALAAAGAVVALVPLTLHTVVHFGTLLPPHIASNAALLGESWAAQRAAYASAWFGASTSGIWRAMPALVAGAVVSSFTAPRGGRSFLWSVAAIDAILVLVTAPNDGGAQWGPRYLLFACIPLTILAADTLSGLSRDGARSASVAAIALVILVGGAWNQRDAYRTLQGTKGSYGELVDFVDQSAGASPYVVTDIWWLDQAVAARPRLIFLFADLDLKRAELLRRLQDAGIRQVIVVTLRQPLPSADKWRAGTCFEETDRTELPRHNVMALRLTCD